MYSFEILFPIITKNPNLLDPQYSKTEEKEAALGSIEYAILYSDELTVKYLALKTKKDDFPDCPLTSEEEKELAVLTTIMSYREVRKLLFLRGWSDSQIIRAIAGEAVVYKHNEKIHKHSLN